MLIVSFNVVPCVIIDAFAFDVADAGQHVVGDLVRLAALPLLAVNVPSGYGAVFVKFRFVVIRFHFVLLPALPGGGGVCR